MKTYIRVFDRIVGDWVDKWPRFLRPLMQLFTLLGQPPITVGISAFSLGYGLALDKQFYVTAGVIALATIAVVSLLKIFLHRERPANDYVEKMLFKTFSFPSGHAGGALVSFGLAAFVVSLKWPELTVVAWIISIVSILMVSVSRIYLGAHYASDIVGGWIVGGIGLLAILLVRI